jgi:uncharacterized protein YciI
MFERLKALYNSGRLSASGIQNAVTKGWLTQEQANEILGN